MFEQPKREHTRGMQPRNVGEAEADWILQYSSANQIPVGEVVTRLVELRQTLVKGTPKERELLARHGLGVTEPL